jgi:hypothetical protein
MMVLRTALKCLQVSVCAYVALLQVMRNEMTVMLNDCTIGLVHIRNESSHSNDAMVLLSMTDKDRQLLGLSFSATCLHLSSTSACAMYTSCSMYVPKALALPLRFSSVIPVAQGTPSLKQRLCSTNPAQIELLQLRHFDRGTFAGLLLASWLPPFPCSVSWQHEQQPLMRLPA